MESTIPSTKRDKRQIKHSLLMSKLKSSLNNQKSSSRNSHSGPVKTAGVTKASNKNSLRRQRHRRKEQLSTNLWDLAEALPQRAEVDEGGHVRPEASGANSVLKVRDSQSNMVELSTKGIRQRKPGYQRRMKLISNLERRRFGRNLASMTLIPETVLDRSKDNLTAHNDSKPVEDHRKSASNVKDARDAKGAQQDQNRHRDRWAALRAHISQNMVSEK